MLHLGPYAKLLDFLLEWFEGRVQQPGEWDQLPSSCIDVTASGTVPLSAPAVLFVQGPGDRAEVGDVARITDAVADECAVQASDRNSVFNGCAAICYSQLERRMVQRRT